MGRAGITYHDVSKVANVLVSQGKNPTVDAVRESLGGTGSKSTLTPLLKRWKTENGLAEAELKSRLPAPLLQAVLSLHEQLQADADRRVQEAADGHAAAAADSHSQIAQLSARLAVLTQERDALTQQVEALRQQDDNRRQQQHELQLQLTRAETEFASLTTRLSERHDEVAAVKQQLAQLRQQFELYQEAVANQREQEQLRVQQQRGILEQELGSLRSLVGKAEQQLAERDLQLAATTQTHHRLETELALANERLRREQQEHHELTALHDGLSTERTAELQQALHTQTELALLQRTHADTLSQLTALQQEIRTLLQANATLTARLQMRLASP